MLIPIGHENMTARRWPIITFALIFINIAAFLVTRTTMNRELVELEKITVEVLLLAATHPKLDVPQELQPVVEGFRKQYREEFEELQNHAQDQALLSALSDDFNNSGYSSGFQEKMDALGKEYARLSNSSTAHQYAFIPAHPNPISYITANFLHGGWLHLIGNMWFLWLAGFVLEDVWGRRVYLAFYIVAGVVALQFYAWTNPGSMVPTLGASGAVAALMGAFLVRFPKIKIEMAWVFLIFRVFRFRASAYWLLSLWLLTEVFYGALFGTQTGIAHWAHVGGFLCGAGVALGIRHSGIERSINDAIEDRIAGGIDVEVRQAREHFDKNELDEAWAILHRYTKQKPDTVAAWALLRDVFWQKQDLPNCEEASLKCCVLHIKAHQVDAAWRDYEDFIEAGGTRLPPAVWFDLCHLLENQGDFETAVGEYGKLAIEYPDERHTLMARMAAGKIYLNKLNRPQEALQAYEAAENSPVPHLDLEQAIQLAVKEAQSAINCVGANAGGERSMGQPIPSGG